MPLEPDSVVAAGVLTAGVVAPGVVPGMMVPTVTSSPFGSSLTRIVGVTVTVTPAIAEGSIAFAAGAALSTEAPSIRTTTATAISADNVRGCVLVTEIPSHGVATQFVVASLVFEGEWRMTSTTPPRT
jgi:hypothetical protein